MLDICYDYEFESIISMLMKGISESVSSYFQLNFLNLSDNYKENISKFYLI